MFSLTEKTLYVRDLDLWIDSMRPRERCYVSHGHSDHARPHARVVTSIENAAICRVRFGRRSGALEGIDFEEHAFDEPWTEGDHRLTLLHAGHVLGSAQLMIEGERGTFVYTGDFKMETSFSTPPIDVRRCDTVLMECTYGRPQYVFPPREEIAAQMVDWAARSLEDGATPVFFAYSLGKAQEAMAILGRARIPLAAHGAVDSMAAVYRAAGIPLPEAERYDAELFTGEKALIWPPSGKALPKALRGKPVRKAVLTGWALGKGAIYRYDCDIAFPLSDHADFPSLLRYLELAQPKTVLLNHGWRDFVHHLRRRGWNAEYLDEHAQLALF